MIINTNISAMKAHYQSMNVGITLDRTMERLSTGLKINRGEDDPSGLGISAKTKAQIRGLNVAMHNVQESTYIYNLRDAYMEEDAQILARMRDLAVRASNDATLTDADRQRIQNEMTGLRDQIDQTAKSSHPVTYDPVRLLYAPGKLDVVWVLDHSGSMDVYANNLKNAAQSMFTGFAGKGFDLMMGATSFGVPFVPPPFDPSMVPIGTPRDSTSTSPVVGTMTDNAAAFGNDVQTIATFSVTTGGGIERGLDATCEALNLIPGLGPSLRPDAEKVFILVTNEGSDDNGEEGPDLGWGGGNTPTQAQIQGTIDALNAAGISLDVAGVWNEQMPPFGVTTLISNNPDPVYQQVAAGTNGISVSLDAAGAWVQPIITSLENRAADWNAIFQVGPDNQTSHRVYETFMSVTSYTLGVEGVSVLTAASSQQALDDISNAITTLSDERALTGVLVKNMSHIANDIAAQHLGDTAFNSNIEDADIAVEFVNNTIARMLNDTVTTAQATAIADTKAASTFLSTVQNSEQVDDFGNIFTVSRTLSS